MRIESIKIQGFKSFRQEAILSFLKNITVIVGPNGSGKSNIADAFRWALGEQSLKNLRSRESTDIIFGGSLKQAKLSRALVTVKFSECGNKENDQNSASALDQLSEIEITRKIYANGESFFSLNKTEVRMLDIQLFLAGSNVGQKNYAVIGQGMIDDILRLSPKDRMDFFFEATGVKKYQIKLRKARLKLIKSQERLDQTKILLKEIGPHKKYLAVQAEKYLKRKTILDDLQSKQRQYYQISFREIEQAYQNKKQDFMQIESQIKQIELDIQNFEQEINQLKKSDAREECQKLNIELKRLEAQRQHWQNKIDVLEAEKERQLADNGYFDIAFLNRRQAEVEDLLNNVKEEMFELEQARRQTQNKQKIKSQEYQKLMLEIKQLKEEKQEIAPKELVKRLEDLLKAADLPQIKKKIQALIDELNSTRQINQLTDLEQLFLELKAEIDELNVKAQVLDEKRRLLGESQDRWQSELTDLQLKLSAQEHGANKEWLAQVKEQKQKYQKEMSKAAAQAHQLEQIISQLNQQEEINRSRFYEAQKKYQSAIDQQKHISELGQAIKIELSRLEFKQEQIKEEMKEHLSDSVAKMILEEPVSAVPFKALEGRTIHDLKSEINALRKEAGFLGEVEEGVVKEYEEVKERFDFLSEQGEDLEAAIQSLQKISRRLQKKIKRQFKEKFNVLDKEFQKYFKVLFGGGSCSISQIELDDGQDGVEITANPPGKKIKQALSLSGGERSMTAAALICAIISSNPPPFVILDEIDAALDEANSTRLVSILQQLSKNTQLIIITHNRATMEIADVLYGVTMDKEGVSRLTGVKLD
ncbi:MAG: AAA family ATPase, partial [Candidatus Jacksonbacteria bacterium]